MTHLQRDSKQNSLRLFPSTLFPTFWFNYFHLQNRSWFFKINFHKKYPKSKEKFANLIFNIIANNISLIYETPRKSITITIEHKDNPVFNHDLC